MTGTRSGAAQVSRSLWLDLLANRLQRIHPDKDIARIGILGALGTGDVGDEAMLVSLLTELEARLENVDFTVFTIVPERTFRYTGIRGVPTAHDWFRPRESVAVAAASVASRLERFITGLPGLRSLPETDRNGWVLRFIYRELIKQACAVAAAKRHVWSAKRYRRLARHIEDLSGLHALVYLGGGYINSWHVKADCYVYLLSAAVAQTLHIPVFGSGMNLGPFNNFDRKHLAPILRRFELIGIRDWDESVRELNRMGIFSEDKHHFSTDDAINLTPTSNGPINDFVANAGPYLALHVHYWRMSDSEWSAFAGELAQAVDGIIERSGRSVIMIPMLFGPNRHEGDAAALRDIAKRCHYHDRMFMAPDNLSPGQLKTLFGRADGALVTRHHAMVFSVTSGVPTVALYFDDYYRMKIVGVAGQFGDLCIPVNVQGWQCTDVIEALASRLLPERLALR
jgi:polysaccharide pyruvyl transferase WcaK-like protein